MFTIEIANVEVFASRNRADANQVFMYWVGQADNTMSISHGRWVKLKYGNSVLDAFDGEAHKGLSAYLVLSGY